jgi:hypothetical protein
MFSLRFAVCVTDLCMFTISPSINVIICVSGSCPKAVPDIIVEVAKAS